MYMNKNFWDLVKKLVKQNKSELKPCKFYASNKELVEKEFKKIKTPKEREESSRFQK